MTQEQDKLTDLELARQVRDLDREMQPERDLWMGIQRQILDHPQKQASDDRQTWMPYAVAASLLIAVSALALNVLELQRPAQSVGNELASLQELQQEYVQVRNPMVEEFTRVNQSLDDRTREELFRNLEIMEKARRELELEVQRNPEDLRLMQMLMKVHEQELELLKQNYTSSM